MSGSAGEYGLVSPDEPDERKAEIRGRYLASTTDLRGSEAEAVAYAELGYSDAGAANRMGSTAGTVGNHLDRAVAQYGPQVAWPKLREERRDLAEVTAEELTDNPGLLAVWRPAAESYPEHVPASLRSSVDESTESETLGGWE